MGQKNFSHDSFSFRTTKLRLFTVN